MYKYKLFGSVVPHNWKWCAEIKAHSKEEAIEIFNKVLQKDYNNGAIEIPPSANIIEKISKTS